MKKPLEQHIARLLYRYDLVTVPGFGTFVAKRRPAYYRKEENTFFPPSKSLTFNTRLRSDDGLLADQVARTEELSRLQARHLIDRITDEWIATLNRHEHLYLEPLGSFVLHEGRLRFVSISDVNFLPEAFGLHPVIRQQAAPASSKPQQTALSLPQAPASSRHRRPRIWYAAAALLVAAGMWWSFSHWGKGIQGTGQVQQASYTWEATLPPVKITPATMVHSSAAGTAAEPHYYLVAGAFGKEANAKALMNKLAARGFSPMLAGTNAKGLHLVAIGAYSDRQTALEAKQQFHRQGQDVWIWEKN